MKIKRGMVLDLNLDPTKGSETGKVRPCIVVTNDVYNERLPVIQVVPITEWSERKAHISTNVTLQPSELNGLSKPSVADCLQTRPVDYKERLVAIRGIIEKNYLLQIDEALKIVFELD
ncbi:MAG: type II toxin-antitoxin system PemK/MazF family toxin [Thermoflexibacter sp.]|jgi:mRNA interferase MazF|nr:type II toxin-antitoxin system PemK/MazF family toxin [Thermoflexibacter sp.]